MKNYSIRVSFISCLVLLSVCLTSCFQEKRTEYPILESCQMGNRSVHDVTLSFYESGNPKNVYTQILNQSSPIYAREENSEKNVSSVSSGENITLHPGQVALFYLPKNNLESNSMVTSLRVGGYSNNRHFQVGGSHRWFVGDSVTISTEGMPQTVLPVKDYAQWETWYDEQRFIYYHIWWIQ